MAKRGRPKKIITPEEVTPEKEPKEKLSESILALQKSFGKGIIASAEDILDFDAVSTNVLLLDILLKRGLPKSTISIFYGQPSSLKSYTTMKTGVSFTKNKERIAIIDTEHAFSKSWAKTIGLDLKYVYVSQPKEYETVIDIADTLVASREFGLVIIDSLTASPPQKEMEKSAYDEMMAKQAKLNATLMRKLSSRLQPDSLIDEKTYNQTAFIGVCHVRDKVGFVMGNPEILPGGWAIKLHSHQIIKFTPLKKIIKEKTKEVVAREIKILVEKAKYTRPLVSGVTKFIFNPPRIDDFGTLLTYASHYGIIKQAGAWYEYGEIREQGINKLAIALKEKPEMIKKIKQEVLSHE